MKVGTCVLVAAVVGLWTCDVVRGQEKGSYDVSTPERRGQAGMTFLQIGGSARAEGMGGAFISVKGDPSVVFYSPAGMTSIGKLSLYANRTTWAAGMSLNHFVVDKLSQRGFRPHVPLNGLWEHPRHAGCQQRRRL
jgi:hypothetical protein